ncbi:MAG: hypothetical protein NTV43_03410 [Methylococcales bacterium]|nr:hypothetical protein [Methylococcales bacterium]
MAQLKVNAITAVFILALSLSASPYVQAAGQTDGSLIGWVQATDPGSELQLEVRLAPLAQVLDTITAKTGVPIHYSALPEGLVTATCVASTPQKIVECLLAHKADLIVRNHKPGKKAAPPKAAEMWVIGSQYSATNCNSPQASNKPPAIASASSVDESEPDQTDDLIAQAKSNDASVRAAAVGALMSAGRPGDAQVKNVLETALSDPDATVRAQAVSSYAHREGSAAVAALQNALHDSDAGVRLMAVDGIGDDATLLQQAINDDDETIRQLALSKLDALQKKRNK